MSSISSLLDADLCVSLNIKGKALKKKKKVKAKTEFWITKDVEAIQFCTPTGG